jgi:D-glycero-alpha-D-manno-heptose-7-phosphate kinase
VTLLLFGFLAFRFGHLLWRMIISKTPLRMSFVGGGSDLAVFYRKHGGAVVSTAINKFVYVTVNRKFDERIRVSYSRTEEAASVGKIKHPLVREAMRMLRVNGGVEITSIADIPAKGTGLGSSSSFTVGVLNALHAYANRYASAEQLARESCVIEIERCGEPIGKQDQYAAAFGGFNFIEFNPDDSVSVEPVICRRDTIERLQANILVFYTGITRSASALLKTQREAVASEKAKQTTLRRMVELARQLKAELQKNNLEAFGEIIHENWELKRSLNPGVSSGPIDRWYGRARRAGAVGGKLLGAGSGGFLMFYAPRARHEAIARELRGLRRMEFGFEPQGSKIIFVHD